MEQLSRKCVFNDLRTDSFKIYSQKEIFTKENYTRWFHLQETMTLVKCISTQNRSQVVPVYFTQPEGISVWCLKIVSTHKMKIIVLDNKGIVT